MPADPGFGQIGQTGAQRRGGVGRQAGLARPPAAQVKPAAPAAAAPAPAGPVPIGGGPAGAAVVDELMKTPTFRSTIAKLPAEEAGSAISTIPSAPARPAWQQLRDAGVQPTGTAAGNRAAAAALPSARMNWFNDPGFSAAGGARPRNPAAELEVMTGEGLQAPTEADLAANVDVPTATPDIFGAGNPNVRSRIRQLLGRGFKPNPTQPIAPSPEVPPQVAGALGSMAPGAGGIARRPMLAR